MKLRVFYRELSHHRAIESTVVIGKSIRSALNAAMHRLAPKNIYVGYEKIV